MNYSNNFGVWFETEAGKKAFEIFSDEIESRTDVRPHFCDKCRADFCFINDSNIDKEKFSVSFEKNQLLFTAYGIRGLIYAIGYFLRKIRKGDSGFSFDKNLCGSFSPDKSIRGHQIGYRTTPNTYDAWDYDQYRRYYLDLMFFGSNVVEHIPYQSGVSKRNRLMKYDEEEFLIKACEMADEFDLDISLWHPNYDNETHSSAAERRGKLYSRLCRLDYLMIPGGDPGSLPADVFVDRCCAISKEMKKNHPNAKMYPSAQAPDIPGWGDVFIDKLEEVTDEIDGVVHGPNHAFPLEVLSDKLGGKFPIRFYPDITHNVRCEYPVHYYVDDWDYALTTCLSRECTNPRPYEYARLYSETCKYVNGSVSYSEGITDDVNKSIWSSLDWNNNADVYNILCDYSRLFFFGADENEVVDAIVLLEKNWVGKIDDNPYIDKTFSAFSVLIEKYPFLKNNWRFLQLYLRSLCDKIIRDRKIFEENLILKSKEKIKAGDYGSAESVLLSELPDDYKQKRHEVDSICRKLFDLIGLQTDVENYCADGWERGAILETIDLPITDRQWLISKFRQTCDCSELLKYFNRNCVDDNEFYFSAALTGVKDKQSGEVYMNFQGDRPNVNENDLPVALFNVFDNFTLVCNISGLCDEADYILYVTYLDKKDKNVIHHKICGNGKVIYEGPQFGPADPLYDNDFCKPGFVSARYSVSKEIIENGKLKLEFSEPIMGVMIAEFSLKKVLNKSVE